MFYFSAVAITGNDLGSGIYFSDSHSKILEFSPPVGTKCYNFAATVAMENQLVLNENDENINPPDDIHSIWGHGRKNVFDGWTTPLNIFDGLAVPIGELQERDHETELEYNEFIARSEQQIESTLYLFECSSIF
jgi:hypothetical protein